MTNSALDDSSRPTEGYWRAAGKLLRGKPLPSVGLPGISEARAKVTVIGS